jgi:hypothetical protein
MASTQPTLFTPGRLLITTSNLFYSIGAFAADFNYTHVYNPRWPPHARFHNGQTMTLGALLTSVSLYFAYLPAFRKGKIDPKDSTFYAAVVGSLYCLAGMSAILYPGTDWKDPEIEFGGQQKYAFALQVVLVWAGYWMEALRLGKLEKEEETGRAKLT